MDTLFPNTVDDSPLSTGMDLPFPPTGCTVLLYCVA